MDLLLLELHNPSEPPVLAGFFLHEAKLDKLEFRLRRSWPELEDPFDREYIENIEETLRTLQHQKGNQSLIEYLESTLSNTLRLSNRLAFHHEATPLAALADRLAEYLLAPPANRSA